MATDNLTRVLEHARRTVLRHDGAGLTDGQLLGCFVSRRDEAAFEALVRRHGPMVLSVCRRIVGRLHDAEDAFQATFLVLAIKAASVVPREAVGNWLHGVAYRTALKARAVGARRRARERQMTDVPQPLIDAPQRQELEPQLDLELNRLPDKVPPPDCALRPGRAHAARSGPATKLADGTLTRRMAVGRLMLARRLTRHGLVLAGGLGSEALLPTAAPAGVPPTLLLATVQAATQVANGSIATTVVGSHVAALVKGEMRTMLLTKLKITSVVLLAVGIAAVAQPGGPAAPPQSTKRNAPGAPLAQGGNKTFPVWMNAKAFVQRDGDARLLVRAELPAGRFLKLTDADGQAVHVHEFANWQPPSFAVDLKDVRVYDTRGRASPTKDWAQRLTEETLVFLEFRDGDVDAQQLADVFRLYRDDLTVLVLPPAIMKGLDVSKAFAPAKSLPQLIPGGQSAPGGPIPPPKK